MAEMDIMYTAAQLIIILAFLVAAILVISTDVVNTKIEEITSSKELTIDAAAELVQNCFKDDDYITTDFLDANKGNNVCNIDSCKICVIDVGVKIEDLDEEKTWVFKYNENSEFNPESILVNIKKGDGVHLGRLYVSG